MSLKKKIKIKTAGLLNGSTFVLKNVTEFTQVLKHFRLNREYDAWPL